MNATTTTTTTTITRRRATPRRNPLTATTVAAFVACCLAAIAISTPLAEAGLATMGLQRDKMPVETSDELFERLEQTRRLQTRQMQELLVETGVQTETTAAEIEEKLFDKSNTETTSSNSNSTNGEDFFEVPAEEEEPTAAFDFAPIEAAEAAIATATEPQKKAEPGLQTISEPMGVVKIRTTGPRGGRDDAAPHLQPTEISFMIMMEDFRYSNGAESVEQIGIGTKFGFSGRIVTKAEELGVASGSCTVTSDIKKELSYCDIFHRIETDNFGGFGSVMVAGSADEVGGRFLVTGTGGSLQSTHQGYAMVQFDPAGNPVLYVLLKLF
eukprot:CAMPEP_0172386418 /NCGR_PEP_ID=MMETSP1061-20121228/3980_1 /TAXON_ID=37318 /ORGANISM="Pseudo-nitzschia pungens, Strain cf. pungens" /LENGTH=326 /DNA_ID=CAMNT_0013115801 /DNA_START=265 /DNA_END=1245 /DNA_ORIENTATION=-